MKSLLKYIFTIINVKIFKFLLSYKTIRFNSILVIAPHPDDEIIGIGGLIIQTLSRKGNVNIVFLTDGEGSGADSNTEEIKRQRFLITQKVLKKLNLSEKNVHYLHLQDGGVPRCQEIGFFETVEKLREIAETSKPEAIFATHPLDYWPYDHVACSELALELKKNINNNCDLWFYWVWSWYHLKLWNLVAVLKRKSVRVDIQKEHPFKLELMKEYLQPIAPNGKPWSGNLPKSMIYPFSKPFEIIEKHEG